MFVAMIIDIKPNRYNINLAFYECLNVDIVLEEIVQYFFIKVWYYKVDFVQSARTYNFNWYAYSKQYMAEIVILVNTRCYVLSALLIG